LRARTLAAIALVRELSARDAPPAPLGPELRHRCHGCSLATVCLPEETLYQIGMPAAEEPAPPGVTRVIPQSDAGAVLYLQEPGSHVGKRSEHLVVKNYGKFIAALMPSMPKNVSLREAQFRRFADEAEQLALAKAVVRAKLVNQRALLMRCLRSEEGGRGSEEPAARDMAELLVRLERVTEMESVLGLEGQGAALYFGEFGRFLKAAPPGRGFDFKGRNRRPPRDPVNALLSFAYALLTKDCFSAVCTVGFDPYKGFFHAGRHGRPSLALDLMEELRAVIADSVVLTLVNNRVLEPGDFVTWGEACQLTEAGRKKFFAAYEQRKATVVTHPVYGYKMSYSRMIEVQARMLAAYVRGDVPAYTGFTVR
jgi:CRISPR-associated protein Cas1